MRINQLLKIFALILVTGSLVIGCAGTTEEDSTSQTSQASGAEGAIAAAERAYKKAVAELYAWRDTGKLIKKAKKALKDGNEDKAIKLANKAKKQADDAIAQKYFELDRIKDIIGTTAVMATGTGSGDYQVVSGDNLWDISAKSEIYANPYQWPLIYKANKSQIKDADLIYPGQSLTIDQDATSSDVDAAVSHAKSRGSWSIGTVEASDETYLSN